MSVHSRPSPGRKPCVRRNIHTEDIDWTFPDRVNSARQMLDMALNAYARHPEDARHQDSLLLTAVMFIGQAIGCATFYGGKQ
jgi:hypothetical protein